LNKKLKTIVIALELSIVVASIIYVEILNTNSSKEEIYVTVPTGSNYEDVKKNNYKNV
jgi:hypothetical protein